MRCCCDENIKRSISVLLGQEGHDVVRVQDELGLSTPDSEIIAYCNETNRVLLTNDDDFFSFDSHPGVCSKHSEPRHGMLRPCSADSNGTLATSPIPCGIFRTDGSKPTLPCVSLCHSACSSYSSGV